MASVYNDTVRAEEMAHLVAASTHYLGQGLYVLRCQAASGEIRNSQSWADLLRSCRQAIIQHARDAAPFCSRHADFLGHWLI